MHLLLTTLAWANPAPHVEARPTAAEAETPAAAPAFTSPAKASAEAALAADPEDVEALNTLTQLNFPNPQQALDYNQRAREIAPEDADAMVYEAVITMILGMPDSALEKFDEAITKHPLNAKAYAYKGLSLMEAQRYADAVAPLEKAIELGETDPTIQGALTTAKAGAPPVQGDPPPPPTAAGASVAEPTGKPEDHGNAQHEELDPALHEAKDPTEPIIAHAERHFESFDPTKEAKTTVHVALRGGAGIKGGDPFLAVELARLQVKVKGKVVKAMSQLEARSGTPQLLDARVDVGGKQGPQLTAGRFKTPMSAELQAAAPALPMRERSLITSLGPRRALGVMGGWKADAGKIQVGVFQVGDSLENGPAVIMGSQFDLSEFVELHVGGAVWEHAPLEELDEEDRVLPGDAYLDGAIVLHSEKSELLVEGLYTRRLHHEHIVDGGVRVVAVQHVFFGDDLELAPAVAYDASHEDVTTHRVSSAVTLWADHHLVAATARYGVNLDGKGLAVPEHTASLSLQLWR